MLARKWRPKNFSELIGQEAVRTTLTNALTQKRVHPVLLFTGPRGTGKTSTARIFAKILRCQNKKDLIPCEKCDDCQTIQSGSSLDVMEIDGASNNGVDAVRDLRDTVNYLPSTGSYKIYIIDEVHMLSTSAFNALLKTLEEPPEHVVFIMATTAANKIPQTVLSRCQRLDFHLISPRPLKEQLEKICKGESISIEEEALWLISKQARGSLRDGQSLLDQMINFCDDAVTLDQITDVLGLTDPSLISDILKAIVQRSEKHMLENIHAFSVKGGEPEILFQNLIESLRDLLILKINPKNSPVLVHASEMEINHLKQLGDISSYEDLHLVFDMLLKAERDLAFCHDKHIALEVLLLRLSQAPRVEFIAPLNVSQISSAQNKDVMDEDSDQSASLQDNSLNRQTSKTAISKTEVSKEQGTDDSSQSKLLRDQTGVDREQQPKFNEKKKIRNIEPDLNVSQKQKEVKSNSSQIIERKQDFSGQRETVRRASHLQNKERDEDSSSSPSNQPAPIPNKKWFAFIEFVRKKDPKLAALVEVLSPKSGNSDTVTFLFPEKMAFLTQLTEPKTHQLLENLLTDFMKSKKRFKIQFQNSKEIFPSLGEQKQDDEAKALMEQAVASPFVQTVNKVFKGQIKNVLKMEKDK